ncbi:hypothetical protein ACFVFS_35950 [Kitasatospora sp. NPDC057692]|uniref:hypothetical protein n=1 Tax=Kitasatospora sp. NPDC057692 TaxID=3346215 RepID=UPI0036B7CC04
MSYELQALIGPAELVAVAAAEVSAARPRPLAQGLALIPATPEFLAALRFGDEEPISPGAAGFDWFSDGLERRLAAWSKAGPIACVEADYFGGTGTQRAALWADGRLALGPLVVAELAAFPPEGSPISRVLRRLGVRLTDTDPAAHDEFDAAGLGAHRATAAWATPR